jgi:hypothetical protein
MNHVISHRTIYFDYEIEFTVKLIQHSTGLAHPLAAIPSISVCRDVYEDADAAEASMSMEIFGENLVLTLAIEGAEQDSFIRLYTFNWKTGTTICVSNMFGILKVVELTFGKAAHSRVEHWHHCSRQRPGFST